LLLAALSLGSARADEPQAKPAPTPERARRLAERERHVRRLQALVAQGQTAEAIAEGEATLAIDREVFGADSRQVAGSLAGLAELYEGHRDWAEARRARRERLPVMTRIFGAEDWRVDDARRELANVDVLAGLSPDQRRSLAEAGASYQQAVRAYEQGRREQAVAAARRSLALREAVLGERHHDSVLSLVILAVALQARGDLRAARDLHERALALRAATLGERHPAYAYCLVNVADVLQAQGDLAAARSRLERARAIMKETLGERHPAYASCLNNLAALLNAQGDLAAARALDEHVLALRKELLGEHHPDYAQSLNNLAAVLKAQGDFAAARPLLEQALEVTKATSGERHPNYAEGLNNLAAVLGAQGDPAAARLLIERALALRKEVLGERHPDYARSLRALGVVLKEQGDLEAARPLFERAAAILKEALGERHPDYARCLNDLAGVLRSRRDLDGARRLYERTVALRKEALGERHPDYAASLNDLATVLADQGDRAAARSLLERALAVDTEALGERHPASIKDLGNLASMLNEQGDLAGARSSYERVLTLFKEALGERHPDYAKGLDNLAGVLLEQGDRAAARTAFEGALGVAQGALLREMPTLSRREQLARLRAVQDDLAKLLSLSADEPGRAEQDYARVLAWRGLVAEAEAIRREGPEAGDAGAIRAEVGAARQVLQRLYQARVPAGEVAEHARAIRRAVEDLEAAETRLARAVRWDPEPPPVRRVGAALPADAALVDVAQYRRFTPPGGAVKAWSVTPHYAAFVIRPGAEVARVELGPAAAIDNAVAAWRERVKNVGRDENTTGRAVRQLVWEPIEPHVKGAKVVLVAPDGALNFVPWGALPDGEGSYLVKRFAFATVGSGRQLIAMAKSRPEPAGGGLLAVGGVDYGADPGKGEVVASRAATVTNGAIIWPGLEGAKAEAEEVAGLFGERYPGATARRLAGSEATRGRLRKEMAGRRYLHLATHGYFAPPELKSALRPDDEKTTLRSWEGMGRAEASGWFPELLSGLVWAGANRPVKEDVQSVLEHDDGAIMTAEEVGGLDLKGCELAVLSACETGLGQTAGGEGVLGLQRAFGQAGCRTVIASLWKVDDRATRDLMASFYGHLWGDRMTPLEALRAAQLELLDDPATAHPAFWAAWSLGGDPGSLPQRTQREEGQEK
jgi:CHAT domain-containing protein/Flp pilus assembly protein TadD